MSQLLIQQYLNQLADLRKGEQTFLKVIYENFYKVYNRKAADRLGVVYTPNEIVRFMIESADHLSSRTRRSARSSTPTASQTTRKR